MGKFPNENEVTHNGDSAMIDHAEYALTHLPHTQTLTTRSRAGHTLSMHSKYIADFKDYEDPSDEFRDKEGTLLPLWKFSYGKFKSMEVTGLCWNSAYQDLFVATLGSCQYI